MGHGRSVCPESTWAARGLQRLAQWVATPRGEANLENQSQLGLGAATRPHELGIPSTRVSTPRGESVSIPCTHRPSLHGSGLRTSVARWVARVLGLQLGRSRNKVAVGEPAAGSPPRRSPSGRPGGEQSPPHISFSRRGSCRNGKLPPPAQSPDRPGAAGRGRKESVASHGWGVIVALHEESS